MADDDNGLPQVDILRRGADETRRPLLGELRALANELASGRLPKLVLGSLDADGSSTLFVNDLQPNEIAAVVHALAQQGAMACESYLSHCEQAQRATVMSLGDLMRAIESMIAEHYGFAPREHS